MRKTIQSCTVTFTFNINSDMQMSQARFNPDYDWEVREKSFFYRTTRLMSQAKADRSSQNTHREFSKTVPEHSTTVCYKTLPRQKRKAAHCHDRWKKRFSKRHSSINTSAGHGHTTKYHKSKNGRKQRNCIVQGKWSKCNNHRRTNYEDYYMKNQPVKNQAEAETIRAKASRSLSKIIRWTEKRNLVMYVFDQ